ncbi:MAG TPA: PEPxxWA-CTERM sorting domain-containing protein [Caulobacteraceae bacterium]|nr:PEPxxWA-CTERM sorting domain-containing protein [Caulobacteraceae bacterium]
MNHVLKSLAVAGVAALAAGQAQATTFSDSLSGVVANFTHSSFNSGGKHYDRYILPLSGLDSTNAFTVSMGDTIDSTVTLDMPYTIPVSMLYTNILEIHTGSSFPNENTAVTGTFSFFDGGTLVNTFNYISSTSGSLASYTANFPPTNAAFTWDSFTNDFTIDTLATPATLDGAYFFYDLVSAGGAVPEPAAWTMMLVGFGLLGGAVRARTKAATFTA